MRRRCWTRCWRAEGLTREPGANARSKGSLPAIEVGDTPAGQGGVRMQELAWFLPAWPPVFGDLALFGALLLAGLLGGELVHRLAALPRITGYVLVGVLCGPHALGLVRGAAARRRARRRRPRARPDRLRARPSASTWTGSRRNRWLALAALGESVGAFFAIYAGLLLLRVSAAAGRLRRRGRHGDLARGGDGGERTNCAPRGRSPSACCCSPRSTACSPTSR